MSESLSLDQLLRLVQTRRHVAVSVVLAVIAVGVALFFTFPQAFSLPDLWRQYQLSREQTTQTRALLARLAELPSDTLLREAEAIDTALPSQKPIFELLSTLETVASETGLVIVKLQLTPGEFSLPVSQTGTTALQPRESQVNRGAEGVQEVNITLGIEGTLAQTSLFFEQLNSIAPFTTLTQLDVLANRSVTSNTEPLQTEIELSTFFYEGVVAAGDQSISQLPPIQPEMLSAINTIRTWKSTSDLVQPIISGGGLEELFGQTIFDE